MNRYDAFFQEGSRDFEDVMIEAANRWASEAVEEGPSPQLRRGVPEDGISDAYFVVTRAGLPDATGEPTEVIVENFLRALQWLLVSALNHAYVGEEP